MKPGLRVTLILAAAVAVLFALHFDVARATVEIWSRFFTYQHGFIVFPVSAWLIWLRRHELAACMPAPEARALLLLPVLGGVALLGRLGGVLALEQLALVLLIPALVWAALGARMTRLMAFPLVFLLFAVPVGDFLVPPLMIFTADFTVLMVKLTGIPIYREGQMISLPSGDWSVVESCSGIRYLIAALVLGTFYAYITYRSLARRLIFVALSVVVPVLANGLRAFLIVMIGHFSDMQYAVGVDHLIYGWVFFGIVMLLLFMIGARWREDDTGHDQPPAAPATEGWPVARIAAVAALGVALVAIPALWGGRLERANEAGAKPVLTLPGSTGGWHAGAPAFTDWSGETPIHWQYPLADAEAVYAREGRAVRVSVRLYGLQRQDPDNLPVPDAEARNRRDRWTTVAFGPASPHPGLEVDQTALRHADQRLLVWRWSRARAYVGADYYRLRAHLVSDRLLGRVAPAADIQLVARYDERAEEAERALRDFVREAMPAIEIAIGAALAQATP